MVWSTYLDGLMRDARVPVRAYAASRMIVLEPEDPDRHRLFEAVLVDPDDGVTARFVCALLLKDLRGSRVISEATTAVVLRVFAARSPRVRNSALWRLAQFENLPEAILELIRGVRTEAFDPELRTQLDRILHRPSPTIELPAIRSEFTLLKRRHDSEVAELQHRCAHEERRWISEYWALGHFTGRTVRVCDNCNAIVDAKVHCNQCRREVREAETVHGDGELFEYSIRLCCTCAMPCADTIMAQDFDDSVSGK